MTQTCALQMALQGKIFCSKMLESGHQTVRTFTDWLSYKEPVTAMLNLQTLPCAKLNLEVGGSQKGRQKWKCF